MTFGSGSSGQLGLGHKEDQAVPRTVVLPPQPANDVPVQIECGSNTTMLRLQSGRVLGSGRICRSLAACDLQQHPIFNDHDHQQEPAKKAEFHEWTEFAPLRLARASANLLCDACCLGWDHGFFVVDGARRLVGFGANDHGQLGTIHRGRPFAPHSGREEKEEIGTIFAIAAGFRHSVLVLAPSGVVMVSGSNRHGQLGIGSEHADSRGIFVSVPGFSANADAGRAVQCAAGHWHTAVLTERGRVFLWGSSKHGQIGTAAPAITHTPNEVVLPCGGIVRSILCGWTHTAALTETQRLYLWGRGDYGQLGNGAARGSHVPVHVPGHFVAVALGSEHAVAVTAGASVLTWGWGEHGQIGNGSQENTLEPHSVDMSPLLMLPPPQSHYHHRIIIGAGGGHSVVAVGPSLLA